MPYLPYSDSKRKNSDGTQKWKLKTVKCCSCLGAFSTRDPYKMYCSTKCRDNESNRRRRQKLKKRNEDRAKIIQQTLKELGGLK
jgi:hypothetical protein